MNHLHTNSSRPGRVQRRRRQSRSATTPPNHAHPGEIQKLDSHLHVMSAKEQEEKRKKSGLCPTCGLVQTHKISLFHLRIPETTEGLVYKGICLKCSNIVDAKRKLGERPTAQDISSVSRPNRRRIADKGHKQKKKHQKQQPLPGSSDVEELPFTKKQSHEGTESSEQKSSRRKSDKHKSGKHKSSKHKSSKHKKITNDNSPTDDPDKKKPKEKKHAPPQWQTAVPNMIGGRFGGIERDISELTLDVSIPSNHNSERAVPSSALQGISEDFHDSYPSVNSQQQHYCQTYNHKGHPVGGNGENSSQNSSSSTGIVGYQPSSPSRVKPSQVGAFHVNEGTTALDRLEARILEKNKAFAKVHHETGYDTLYDRKLAGENLNAIKTVGAVSINGPIQCPTTGDATLYHRKLAGEDLRASISSSSHDYSELPISTNQHPRYSTTKSKDARSWILNKYENEQYDDILHFLKDSSMHSPSITVLALGKLRDGLPMVTTGGRSKMSYGSSIKLLSIPMSTHSTNEVIQLESIRTLWTITSLTPRNATELISNPDAMEGIFKAMTNHGPSETVQECAAGLIASLSKNMRHALQLSNAKSGDIIKLLVRALNLQSRKGGLQEQLLKALFRLSLASIDDNNNNNNGSFGEIMGRYCRGGAPNPIHAMNAIVDQMQNYPDNLGVQIWACRLLWNVLSSDAPSGKYVAFPLFVGNVLPHLDIVSKNNPNNVPLHEAITCFCSKLSCYGAILPNKIDIFVRLIVRILSNERHSWIVALHGCRCIYNLCAGGDIAPKSRLIIAQTGGIDAIFTCMQIFAKYLPIQGEACGALAAACIESKQNKLSAAKGIRSLYFAFISDGFSFYDDHSLSTKIRVCTALMMLGVEPECMKQIRSEGILLKFKEMINESSSQMPQILLEMMEELLSMDEGHNDDVVPIEFLEGDCEDETVECLLSNFYAITKPNGSIHITHLLRSNILRSMKIFPHCTSIQELGCRILACIYNLLNTKISPIFDDLQELETITKCLRENMGSPGVVKAACSAIKNYCMTHPTNAAPRGLSDTLSRSALEVSNAIELCLGVPHVIEHAIGALWALCTAIKGLSLDDTINNVIIAMKEFNTSFELQTNCVGVLESFFSSHENAQNWVTEECVSCIIRFIERFKNEENEVDIAVNALMTITNLGYGPVLALLENEFFIDSVISCMFKYPENTSIQAASCYILSNIALDNYLRSDISSRGGTGRVVIALNKHGKNFYVVCKALVALDNLIGGAETEILRGSQTTQNLLAVMQAHRDNVFVQVKGTATLWNLSSKDDSFKQEIVQQGGARMISEAMTQFICSKKMQEKGIIALWSLSTLRDLKAQVGKHALVPIINGMAAHASEQARKLAEEGLGILRCLSVDSRNKILLEDLYVVDLILSCMWIHSECASVQQAALAALSNVSVNVVTNKILRMGRDDLDAIINAMRSHPDSQGVQESAIIFLRNHTFSPSNYLILQKNVHLISLIRMATRNHPYCLDERAKYLLSVLPD